MANPIKETPLLYGEDARKFIEENTNITKVSEKERLEIQKSYKALRYLSK